MKIVCSLDTVACVSQHAISSVWLGGTCKEAPSDIKCIIQDSSNFNAIHHFIQTSCPALPPSGNAPQEIISFSVHWNRHVIMIKAVALVNSPCVDVLGVGVQHLKLDTISLLVEFNPQKHSISQPHATWQSCRLQPTVRRRLQASEVTLPYRFPTFSCIVSAQRSCKNPRFGCGTHHR